LTYEEPITFLWGNGNQKIVLLCIGIDDNGYIMQPPIGEYIENSILGKVLVGPDGIDYKINSIAVHQNLLWLG
jgi:hypothetical protein